MDQHSRKPVITLVSFRFPAGLITAGSPVELEFVPLGLQRSSSSSCINEDLTLPGGMDERDLGLILVSMFHGFRRFRVSRFRRFHVSRFRRFHVSRFRRFRRM